MPRFNIDGVLSVLNYGSNPGAYSQLFRNGITESSYIDNIYGQNRIAGAYHEQHSIKFIETMIEILQMLEVPPPFAVFLTFVGVKDHSMYFDSGIPSFVNNIDRDIVNLPEIIINDYDTEIGKAMKPTFDAMWNAAGWEKSPYYDAQGNRIQRR
jgi:hypothetical protein